MHGVADLLPSVLLYRCPPELLYCCLLNCCTALRNPRVVSLPHLGCATEEAYHALASVLCDNITRIREGRELLHRLCWNGGLC